MGYVNKTYLSTQFKNFADKIAKVFSKIGHTHLKSDITDFPTSMPANGGNAATVGGHTVGVNVPSNAKFTDTTYSNFVKSGSGAKNGLVPAPSTTAGTTKYLREDGTWKTPPNTNTWIAFKGATTSAAGTAGYAPAPSAGAANRYLRSDGTWSVPPDNNTTYSAATQSAQGLMSAADKKKLDGIASGATANTGTVTQVKVGTSTYNPSSGIIQLPAYPTSLPASGDSKDCTTTFTSGDSSTGSSTPPAVITSGETHKSLFNKLSTAVKNVRWLLSKMGTTDISAIGNGTVTGALSTLNSNIAKKQNIIYCGTFLYSPTVQAKQFYKFDADLKNLNLQGKSIFWGYAYQPYLSDNAIFEEAVISSSWMGDRVSVLLYNGHNTAMTISVLCVAFAT